MKALVTGGHGFLGGAIVRQLREAGHAATPMSRRTGVDVADYDTVRRAVEGHDVVFHAAAMPGIWGDPAVFAATNVTGTANVVRACVDLGVPKLVFTGSPSSVFDGRDHVDAGNDLPYPPSWEAHYPRTKALSEQLVLAANGPALATVSLRPHLIYGADDQWLLPRLFERAKRGRLRIVGAGDNRVSLTYIDNAAAAHVQAEAALRPGAPCAGRAYFVTDPEPVALWSWINALLSRLGLPVVTRRVSLGTARAAGAACEWAWSTFRLAGDPPVTRFMAAQLGTSHTYSTEPARRDLGYVPPVANAEAFERTVAGWTGRV